MSWAEPPNRATPEIRRPRLGVLDACSKASWLWLLRLRGCGSLGSLRGCGSLGSLLPLGLLMLFFFCWGGGSEAKYSKSSKQPKYLCPTVWSFFSAYLGIPTSFWLGQQHDSLQNHGCLSSHSHICLGSTAALAWPPPRLPDERPRHPEVSPGYDRDGPNEPK